LLHDLRRTAARSLRLAGVDREQARLFTGHRTEAMFDRCNVGDDLRLRDASERLTAYMTHEQSNAAASSRTVAPPRPRGARVSA